MPDLTKIATCCYCGNRAVLQLRGRVRHELSCASCGAALHNMKQLKPKSAKSGEQKRVRPYHGEKAHKVSKSGSKSSKRRKRRGWGYLLGEILDEIEDIFD